MLSEITKGGNRDTYILMFLSKIYVYNLDISGMRHLCKNGQNKVNICFLGNIFIFKDLKPDNTKMPVQVYLA